MLDLCVGRVKCIFSLPSHAVSNWFPAGDFLIKHFAYVEWFTPFSQAQKDPNSKLLQNFQVNDTQWGTSCKYHSNFFHPVQCPAFSEIWTPGSCFMAI